jgi:hypothetical protein
VKPTAGICWTYVSSLIQIYFYKVVYWFGFQKNKV